MCNGATHVVEIGCGDGILTQALSYECPNLTVIEIDSHCIERTQQQCSNLEHVQWIHQDVLTVDPTRLNGPLTVVANIPYYLSAKLIQWFARYKTCFDSITIMIQAEFADKCLADVGVKSYTSLSVFSQRHFTMKKCFDVSRTCFKPVPKVDSTVIKLQPKVINLPVPDRDFDRLVNACFWGKRKKLSTALNKNPYISFDRDVRTYEALAHLLQKRADQLSLNDYCFVAEQLFLEN